jgi:hypothetical protein
MCTTETSATAIESGVTRVSLIMRQLFCAPDVGGPCADRVASRAAPQRDRCMLMTDWQANEHLATDTIAYSYPAVDSVLFRRRSVCCMSIIMAPNSSEYVDHIRRRLVSVQTTPQPVQARINEIDPENHINSTIVKETQATVQQVAREIAGIDHHAVYCYRYSRHVEGG